MAKNNKDTTERQLGTAKRRIRARRKILVPPSKTVDIKKSEHEALEYAESIINTIREPLIALDQNLRVITASRSFYEVFQVKPEETEGQLIYDLGNKQWDIPKLRELLETILPQKTTFDNYEVEHEFSTIGKRVMLLNARQIQRLLGKERVILLTIEDITERKKIEGALQTLESKYHILMEKALVNSKEELKISQKQYRILVDNANEAIVVAQDNQLKFVNPMTFKLFPGYSEEELLNRAFIEFVHPDDRVRIIENFQKRMRNEPISPRNDYRFVMKDGTVRWAELGTALVEWEGRPATLNFISDITERKQMEEALKTSETRYRRLFETSRDGILIQDAATGVVVDVNPFLIEMLGFPRDEFLGKAVWELKCVKDSIAVKDMFMELQVKKYVRCEDLPLETAAGQSVDVEFIANVYKVDETEVIQCNIRNITERKEAEKEKRHLEEKAQVTSRLAAVGEMVAGVAHEINNPLTGVLGFSQMLLEKENVPEDIREDIKSIAEGSQRVADIVKRLLTFARQTKPVRTLANLNELIENTLKLREYVLKTSNIEVVTRFDPELPWSVVDPGQLQQVFLNLIVNAEQAMKKAHGRGTLIITTIKNDNNIRITFQDDGPGITKENLTHLFEPFFTTKAPGEGTGLGLSLSHSIVLEHEGQLWVESEFGHGATFTLILPIIEVLSPETEALTPIVTEKSIAPKQSRIMVVDDESNVRILLEKVLTGIGYSVDTIDNAGFAMDKLEAGAIYDVILTDVRMPGMNGIELYTRVIKQVPEMRNRIIFITGDVMGLDIKTFLTENNLSYLAKPFDNNLLKEKIDYILNMPKSQKSESAKSDK